MKRVAQLTQQSTSHYEEDVGLLKHDFRVVKSGQFATYQEKTEWYNKHYWCKKDVSLLWIDSQQNLKEKSSWECWSALTETHLYSTLIFRENLATYWEKDTLYFLGKVVWMTFQWDVPTIGLVIELNTCPCKNFLWKYSFLEKKQLSCSLLWENVPFWKLSSQILSSNNIIKVFPRRGKCCAVRW